MARLICLLVREPIDAARLQHDLRADADGAVASFVGVVRDHHRGRGVTLLEYQAYEEMTREEMARIAADLAGRHEVSAVGLAHRLGRLGVGEASVAVVVAAGHRRAALACCADGIEEIKRRLPIWKKEFFRDGGEPAWVFGPEERATPQAARRGGAGDPAAE